MEVVAVDPAGGDLQHVGPGEAVVQQRGVGAEQAAPPRDVAVVAGVEGGAAAGVELRRRRSVVAVASAGAAHPQPGGVARVECRVGRGAAGGGVEAVGVGRAVRLPQRVRPRQHGEVLDVEALGGERLHHEPDVAVQRRELPAAGGAGGAAVAAAQRDGPGRALGQRDGVARHERQDVRAGDGARARRLQLVLDPRHDVEAAEAAVGQRILLRRVVGRRVQQHGRVAPLKDRCSHRSQ